MRLDILYRGSLSSCNYDCSYCPFAKHWESPAELKKDRTGLERFCDWIQTRRHDQLGVFFTPWGETLVRSWYRDAIEKLSHLPNVGKVAVQTNLSCRLDWLCTARTEKLGFWCTYHPSQTTLQGFLQQCERLNRLEIKHSVGCVGLREHLPDIQALRDHLPATTYVWINAYKSKRDYYDDSLLSAFARIDPLFPLNNTQHPSRGRSCRTGHSVFTVDSSGDVRRCHFVDQVIGNIYHPQFETVLARRPCPNATCGCHIGYVHLEHLQLDRVFGEGLLERVPKSTGMQSGESLTLYES